jgi:hypothetical protein
MEKYIMRYLKKFENNNNDLFDKCVKDSWTPFTIEMLKKFCDMCDDYADEVENIKYFFNNLDDEYIDVESYDLYKVYYNTEGMRDADFPGEVVYTDPIKVIAICEANGQYHAVLKTSLKYKDPEMIEYLEAKKISEEDIEEKIKEIEEEKNIWTNIL